MESCIRTVFTLRLQSERQGTSPDEHQVLISSLFDLKLESMVTSIALLIRYLERHLPQVMLAHKAWSVLSVRHILM